MNTTAHASYAFLLYLPIVYFTFGVIPNSIMCLLILIAGASPDFDGIYHALVKKKSSKGQNFQHHLYYWTHWPSSYLPLIIVFAIALALGFFPEYFLIIVVGPYFHLVCDSISCGDGLMWGMSIWRMKRGKFSKYINLDSQKTDGYHGNYWSARYRTTKYFIFENIAAIAVIAILIYFSINQGFDYLFLLSIIGVGACIASGFTKLDPKFYQEPPQGRYADYHIYPPYVQWHQAKYGHPPIKKFEK